VEKHRNSGKSYNMSMIVQNTEPAACKCFKCKQVIAGFEDSYSCIYCQETYCPPCLGYIKFYDLEELEQMLAQDVYSGGGHSKNVYSGGQPRDVYNGGGGQPRDVYNGVNKLT